MTLHKDTTTSQPAPNEGRKCNWESGCVGYWEWAMMELGLRWLFGLCVLHKQRLTLLPPFATSAPLQRDVIYDCWFPASHSHAHWVALPYLWVYWQLNAGLINYFELKVFRRFISRKIKIEVNLPCLMCNCPPFETVDYVGGEGVMKRWTVLEYCCCCLFLHYQNGNKDELSLTKNFHWKSLGKSFLVFTFLFFLRPLSCTGIEVHKLLTSQCHGI